MRGGFAHLRSADPRRGERYPLENCSRRFLRYAVAFPAPGLAGYAVKYCQLPAMLPRVAGYAGEPGMVGRGDEYKDVAPFHRSVLFQKARCKSRTSWCNPSRKPAASRSDLEWVGFLDDPCRLVWADTRGCDSQAAATLQQQLTRQDFSADDTIM